LLEEKRGGEAIGSERRSGKDVEEERQRMVGKISGR